MRLRDRFHDQQGEYKPAAVGEPSSDSSLIEAEELLKAGDEAIRKALSANSVEFLIASRQSGGQ